MKSLSVSHVTEVIIYMCIYFIYRDYIVCEDQAISVTSEKVWIECLGLFETDREIVLSPTGWLNDRIINAAQTLLKNQFPELSGFQDVGLGQVMNFTIEFGEFIQIVHSPLNHWVTISTLMQDLNISLYDSLYSGGIPRLLQAQITCLMSTEHDDINVNVVDVQSQVKANIKINCIHVCYWLFIDKDSNTCREYKLQDFLDYTSIFRHCSTSVQTFKPTFYT